MKVIIGTRHWLGPEWTHVDIDPSPLLDEHGQPHPVDVVCDARHVRLPSSSAEHVYSQEMIEHVPWREYPQYLAEWTRILAPSGTIVVETPDLLAACRQVLETDTLEMDRAIQQIIFGGQSNEFDFHRVGLTPRMLADDFTRLGLDVVEIQRGWEAGYLRVTAQKP